MFVRDGFITDRKSVEDPSRELSDELVYTYVPSMGRTRELVGRGWWSGWNPGQDDLTPETAFSDDRLTYQIEAVADDTA